MLNTSFRILNDRAEAEDVLQEAFLEAFTRIDLFRGESAFGAWLRQIVVNKSINKLRSGRVSLISLDEGVLEIAADQAEDEAETDWKVARVRQAIQLLPEGYRVVLSLYLVEGYDHEEISAILSIAESTSRSQFLRARKKLLEIVKETGLVA